MSERLVLDVCQYEEWRRPGDSFGRPAQCVFYPHDDWCAYQPPPNECSDEWPGEYGEFRCEVPR